ADGPRRPRGVGPDPSGRVPPATAARGPRAEGRHPSPGCRPSARRRPATTLPWSDDRALTTRPAPRPGALRWRRRRVAVTVRSSGTAAVSWSARAGAGLAVGSSPAALVLGAGIADRHGGAAAALPLVLGALVMGLLLAAQGLLGLARPLGESASLSALAPR